MPFLVALFLFLSSAASLYSKPLSVQVHAESALLMNAKTGAILYEKNAHRILFPASVTKIATALYTLKFKNLNLEQIVTIQQDAIVSTSVAAKKNSGYKLPSHWLEPDSMHMGLKTGEKISLNDLLHGMLLVSANDAANSIAIHVAGSVPAFMDQLNVYLKTLGCKNTHFCNPHGIFHPQHQTTAYDLALMAKEALKDPVFRQIVAKVQHPRPKTNKQEGSILLQTNKLLRKGKTYYSKAIGIKTGYVSQAGHTFVAAAAHEGRILIAVLLKTKERSDMFTDAAKLFEKAFSQTKTERILLKAGPQKAFLKVEGTDYPIIPYIKEDLKVAYYPAEESKLKCLVSWDNIDPPVKKNQKVGLVRVVDQADRLLATVPLLASEDSKEGISYKFRHFLTHFWQTYRALSILIGILGSALLILAAMRMRQTRR